MNVGEGGGRVEDQGLRFRCVGDQKAVLVTDFWD